LSEDKKTDEKYDDDFYLVDLYPKNNKKITYDKLDNICFKFSKPVKYKSLCYMQFEFIRIHTLIQFDCFESIR